MRFLANTVTVDDSDKDFILVGVADERDGEYREQLHFQRSHGLDEQDEALDLGGVYAERNGQGEGGYGVERVELRPSRMRVVVGGQIADRMGTPEFDITFAIKTDQFERLRSGLRAVFAGLDSLTEYAAEPDIEPGPAPRAPHIGPPSLG